MALAALIAALVIIGVSALTDCDRGEFTGSASECKFNCEYSNLIDRTEVSFESIYNACPEVQEAADAGECSGLQDLEWPWNGCSCPYCQCYSDGTDDSIQVTSYQKKECYSCTCGDVSGYSYSVFECEGIDEMYSSAGPSFAEYSCPVSTCSYSYNSLDYEAIQGDTWWQSGDDGDCTTYCHCSSSGTTTCQETYADMLSDSELSTSFKYECEYNIADCQDEPERMFYADYSEYCGYYGYGSCPKCDCGNYTVGDSWLLDAYSWEYDAYICKNCSCITDYYGYTYADCSYIYGDDDFFMHSCDIKTSLNEGDSIMCHNDEWVVGSSTVGDLNNQTCTYEWYGDSSLTPSQPYCSYRTWATDDGYDYYNWGCLSMDNFGFRFCEPFGTVGECSWYNRTGITRNSDACTYEIYYDVEFQYCCTTDDCNYKNITNSTETCTRNTEYEALTAELIQCMAAWYEDETYLSVYCGESVDSLSCTALQSYYTMYVDCYCDYYASFYDRLSSATQYTLQLSIESIAMESAKYNNILGCDIHIECNLETGTTVNYDEDSVMKLDVLGVFMVTVVAFIITNS